MSDHSWHMAALALRLLAVDPAGLGGAVIRMRASPDRDAMLASFDSPLPLRKMPGTISDEQLFGGIDLSATLASSQIIETKGFFANPCIVILPMAERCTPTLAAKLASLMDQSLTQGILAIDEGAEPDEHVAAALSERLAFHIEPVGRRPRNWAAPLTIAAGAPIQIADALIQLTELAAAFGIHSLRAPTLALHAARAHARLNGRDALMEGDVEAAAALVFPHRATTVPQEDEADDPPPPEQDPAPEPDDADGQQQSDELELPDGDMLIAAVKALLPPGLLEGLVPAGTSRSAGGAGAGQTRTGNRRGRPLPSRPGRLESSARIDLVATLRAAAPWQPLRRQQQPGRTGLLIRPSDIRLKRYAEQSDRLLIFCVDASGSAAMSRLGEAKGAIELLLAEAYASRDHVALIAFRGTEAETLLPPTRSLVQTKRRLSALPGGGGTPLASGLQHAMLLGQQSRSKGLTPTVILITDGRANIALDGSANRAQAGADAEQMASVLRGSGISALVLDMSNRPQPALQALGRIMNAPYIPLPRANAERLTDAVTAALDA
ncbi:magnesium chelatase subunit D [Tateyamaria pelophila]|uniref:magnesium chelatase subunit D n=1 Tax=Tateyamaria pelophila TaxID=328415 RepID=UPI001CBF2DBA|nr:magnesium chelatase subunit D [Tateyamaria pelophila]